MMDCNNKLTPVRDQRRLVGTTDKLGKGRHQKFPKISGYITLYSGYNAPRNMMDFWCPREEFTRTGAKTRNCAEVDILVSKLKDDTRTALWQKKLELSCYTDSDYAADRDRRRSITGPLILASNQPILWCLARQAKVTNSSIEAE